MILIDSREKPKAITKIIKYFEENKIDYDTSKLYVGDYQSLDNPKIVVIDGKATTIIASMIKR